MCRLFMLGLADVHEDGHGAVVCLSRERQVGHVIPQRLLGVRVEFGPDLCHQVG